MSRIGITGLLSLCVSVASCQSAGPVRPLSEYRADQAEAKNMRLVGFNQLQRRSAYQPVIHQQGGRWIAYIGHHGGKPKMNPLNGIMENNGTSIVDVTDPGTRSTSRTSRARRAGPSPAARRWCGSATAATCRKATATRSTCCAPSGLPRTRCGTSPTPRSRRSLPSS